MWSLGSQPGGGSPRNEQLEELLAGGLGDVDKGEAVFEGEEHGGSVSATDFEGNDKK